MQWQAAKLIYKPLFAIDWITPSPPFLKHRASQTPFFVPAMLEALRALEQAEIDEQMRHNRI